MRAWLLALLAALTLAAPATADPGGRVLSVKFGGVGDRTRIMIASDKHLKYHVFALNTGGRRIVVDLPRVRWSLDGLTAEMGSGAGKGLVTRFSYSQNSPTTSRLVLELAEPALVARKFVLTRSAESDTDKIVIDLEKASPAAFAKSAALDPSTPRAAAEPQARKPLVVIDPGHGGKDPGASSPAGTHEKDVTLAIALAVRDELLKTRRYDVALTRSTDVFIELDQRVAKARALGADLFIALHADAGGNGQVRGASVYTLSPEGEKRAENERHKNDWVMAVETDQTRPPEVNQILADLVQRETKNQSARFAQVLAASLDASGWPMLPGAHRKRGFYVLLSPDVPALLLEMGFITNTQDEAMMTSEAKRRRLVEGIASAIDGFFSSEAGLLAQR
jgi:N-acetylmuramoyl-L-alanine amidase